MRRATLLCINRFIRRIRKLTDLEYRCAVAATGAAAGRSRSSSDCTTITAIRIKMALVASLSIVEAL
jgi:hypothetical protein